MGPFHSYCLLILAPVAFGLSALLRNCLVSKSASLLVFTAPPLTPPTNGHETDAHRSTNDKIVERFSTGFTRSQRATVLFVKPWGGLITGSTAAGIDLSLPAADLWTARLCFMPGWDTVASPAGYRGPWH
jgi:hypothetical protein